MRSFKLAAVLLCVLLLAGCWDKVEIEDRIFVLGIGVDKVKEEEKVHPDDKYAINFASPIVSSLKDGGGETFNTYKTMSEIFTFGLNQMYERMDKKLSFQHTRILLFGDDILKDDILFREVLDAIGRSHEFHRNMYVFAVPGRTEEVFKVKPVFTKFLATYIAGVADNNLYQSSILKVPAYDMYNELTDTEGNVIIPVIKPAKEEIKVSGARVIKNYKLIGNLDDRECETLNWLRDEANGGLIEGEHEGVKLPFIYYEFKTKMELTKVEGDKIYITFSMDAEGSSEEYIWGRNLLDQEVLNKAETAIEKNIEKRGEDLVRKFQKEYKVDLIGISSFIRKYHPNIYKTIEKDYDNFFENNIVVDIKADAVIRRVGVIE
ncbi:MAG: germination protein Ger(x)C family [Clostridia bacterium]|jgi:Ger(x)C family germination protein|nr:germination protein Ger(x)C family [Clostridia bacterium]